VVEPRVTNTFCLTKRNSMNLTKMKRKLKELEKCNFDFEPTRKNAELFVDEYLESAVAVKQEHDIRLLRHVPCAVTIHQL
jgi:hypothetical protein